MSLRPTVLAALSASLAALTLSSTVALAQSRTSAFQAPSAATGQSGPRVVGLEPVEAKVDVGDLAVGQRRETSVVFGNNGSMPIEIERITVGTDSNVAASLSSNDCADTRRIGGGDRCTVTLNVEPKVAGMWFVDVMVQHTGNGRLARTMLTGRAFQDESRGSPGGLLAVGTKNGIIEFGDVTADLDSGVRTVIVRNNFMQPVALTEVAVVAEPSVSVLEQGCAAHISLAPGQTCPLTLVWKPAKAERLSTEVLVRHNGDAPPLVVRLDGRAKENDLVGGRSPLLAGANGAGGQAGAPPPVPPPGTSAMPPDIQKLLDQLTPAAQEAARNKGAGASIFVSGMAGNRAVLSDGKTNVVVGANERVSINGVEVLVREIRPTGVSATIDGKKKDIPFGSSPSVNSPAERKPSAKENKKPAGGKTS